MTDLIDDYLAELRERLGGDPASREETVHAIRARLRADAEALEQERPTLARLDAQREAIARLGSVADVARDLAPVATPARGAPPPGASAAPALVYRAVAPSGVELAERAARGLARGARSVAKGALIALAVLLVVGLGVGAWAYHELRPVIERNMPYSVYSHSEWCAEAACTSGEVTQSFFVYPEAREVRMSVNAHQTSREVDGVELASGALRLVVRSSANETLYERTLEPSTDGSISEALSWPPATGEWRITYELTEYRGWFDVEIHGVGLPRDATALDAMEGA